MTRFFTNDVAEMLDDTGNLIAELDLNTILDSVANEGPDAVKVRDRLGPDAIKVRDTDDPSLVGWVARGKLTEDSPVAPTLEIPRFIENAQDAANTINWAFAAADKVELSSAPLLVFAWIESKWENAGTDLPVPTGPQPETRFGPFGFLPGPWAATIANPKYAQVLQGIDNFKRIDPDLQCYVAACLVNQFQTSLRAATGSAPSSTLIRIAFLVGAEEGSRFARLAPGDRVDTVVDGQPALTAATIAAHGDLFSIGGASRTRAEVEATVEAQLKEAAKAAADKAAEFNQTLDAQRAPGREPSREGMIFPMRQRPVQDYHTDDRQFGANRAPGKRKHAGCDLIAAPGTEILAMADGEVIEGPYRFHSGTDAIEIRHDDGTVVRYGEIANALPTGVRKGARVSQGQVIARVGRLNSGSSMLHLEMYRGTETGSLTERPARPGDKFNRRADLMDPAPFLDAAALLDELSAAPATVGAARVTDRWVAALRAVETNGASATTAVGAGLPAGGVETSQKMAEEDLPRVAAIAGRFVDVAAKFGVPAAVLAALASRESRCGAVLRDGWGDNGNAFGIMQVDQRSHRDPKGQSNPASLEHIEQAAGIFIGYLEQVMRNHREWANQHLLKGAAVAYNCGVSNVRSIADMDKGTTGEDYGSDVMARAQYYLENVGEFKS